MEQGFKLFNRSWRAMHVANNPYVTKFKDRQESDVIAHYEVDNYFAWIENQLDQFDATPGDIKRKVA